MKTKLFFLIFTFSVITFLFSIALAQASTKNPVKLTIKIDNIRSADGKIYIGIHNTAESYYTDLTEGVKELILISNIPSIQGSIEIPVGKYAIAVYQDTNSNAKLDTDPTYGMPIEPWGLSNNIQMPNFQKGLISVEGDTEVIIRLR